MLLRGIVHAADVSEQAGARRILKKVATTQAASPSFFQRLRRLWLDAGSQASKDFCVWVKARLGWQVEVIKRADVNAQKKRGFILRPRRWVVERTFAWLDHLSAPQQRLRASSLQSSATLVYLAMTNLMLHRLKPG